MELYYRFRLWLNARKRIKNKRKTISIRDVVTEIMYNDKTIGFKHNATELEKNLLNGRMYVKGQLVLKSLLLDGELMGQTFVIVTGADIKNDRYTGRYLFGRNEVYDIELEIPIDGTDLVIEDEQIETIKPYLFKYVNIVKVLEPFSNSFKIIKKEETEL